MKKIDHLADIRKKYNISKKSVRKIVLKSNLAPGDTVMFAYAVKALGEQCRGKYEIGIDATAGDAIFEANPYVNHKLNKDNAEVIELEYPTIHKSNESAQHFAQAYVGDLANKLNIKLEQPYWNPAIWLSDEEKSWIPQVETDKPYWIINAGHKNDFTTKAWSFSYWQELIKLCKNTKFVQIGDPSHNHPELEAPNVTNMIGKTDIRQLIRLVYHSFGVISPVSFPFHLGYAIEWKNRTRGIICIAGGRESAVWQTPPVGQYLHTIGMLDCCEAGGCWKSRVVPLNDGDDKDKSLCLHPVHIENQVVPLCQQMITPSNVASKVFLYEQGANL